MDKWTGGVCVCVCVVWGKGLCVAHLPKVWAGNLKIKLFDLGIWPFRDAAFWHCHWAGIKEEELDSGGSPPLITSVV